MTSSDVIVSLTGTPNGTCSSLISRGPSGCCRCHIHCLPTTNISIEALGGRELLMYRLLDHMKIPAQISAGMTNQVTSRIAGGGMSLGLSPGLRRRYLIM